MKRIVSFLIPMVALMGLTMAQNLRSAATEAIRADHQPLLNPLRRLQNPTRSVPCGPDTLNYASYKNLSNTIRPLGFVRDTGIISHAAQWFPTPNEVTVSGVNFVASVGTETNYTIDVTVEVWAAGADSLPTGSALASTTATIDSAVFPRISVSFPTPATIPAGNGFVVSVGTPDVDSVALFWGNDYVQNEGLLEDNSVVGVFNDAQAFWVKASGVNVGGSGYNGDFLIEPYVTYRMNTDFTGPTGPEDCTPANRPVELVNTTSGVAKSRYYNGQTAFKAFRDPSANDFTFTWRFTATDSLESTADTISYTYTNSAPSFDVELETILLGLSFTGCVDDTSKILPSGTPATADFSEDADTSLTVAFTDASVNADSVRYAFGDPDNSTSSDPNPTFTYPGFGTYQVIQIAYNACGNDTAQFSITIEEPEPEPVGIAELPASQLRIFPNPSEGVFQVAVQATGEMTLRVYNLVGQEVLRQAATGEATLDLSAQRPGVYLLEGEVAGQRFARRLLVK